MHGSRRHRFDLSWSRCRDRIASHRRKKGICWIITSLQRQSGLLRCLYIRPFTYIYTHSEPTMLGRSMIQMTRCVCSRSLNVYTSSSTRTTICTCPAASVRYPACLSKSAAPAAHHMLTSTYWWSQPPARSAAQRRRSPTACGGVVVRDPCRAPPIVWSIWRTLDLGQIRPADATCCLVLEVGRR